MSESEKKKRGLYRKNREKWIFAQSVIIAVITVSIIISSLVSYNLNKTYYVGYRENGSIDYNVFLKENEFYESVHLEKDQSYVASLIDKIIANFNYEIDMDTEGVNYRYSYHIESTLEIIDETSNAPLFNPKRELVKVQNKSQSTSNRLVINEIVVLNYNEYNDLASKFIETYSLSRTKSNIVVTLVVDVLSDCDAFSSSSVETYTSELRIPLTTQTVNIKMTSKVPDAEAKMIACARGAGSEVFKTTAIVLSVVDALLILLLVAFIYLTRTADITYTAKVKKIVSQYKSYIQKINNRFSTIGYQIILVDKFDELLEIKDTIQAPILMYENEDNTCAKFMIPTDSKLLYLYEISVEGYEDPVTEKAAEPTHTTIVKPNITNVVRPVVKVVVNSASSSPEPEADANIETIVEDAEVEIEADDKNAPTVITTVEESEDTDDISDEALEENSEEISEEISESDEKTDAEVKEILASIPKIEDEDNTVEAIDVFWEERTHKTYRYDPDGNKVEAGDVVLVPTRDEHSDKNVIREAEVAKGNYKVDPATLDHPLKKIIGVVKRRAEKVFTAMITPDDTSDDENTENEDKNTK